MGTALLSLLRLDKISVGGDKIGTDNSFLKKE